MSEESRVTVVPAPESLDVEALRAELDLTGCGSVVSFLGVTRGEEDGVVVERLEFDGWEEQLPIVLRRLGEEAIENFGVYSVAISHRTGSVEPSEPIVAIHVASPHRAEGFEACSWLIDELKSQAPLWKREVRADGAIWKAGLG
jgi:molybdopterin synthase catalytic subunit